MIEGNVKDVTVFFRKPGGSDRELCKVCLSECNMESGVNGPTSYIAAIAGVSGRYDRFTCPLVDKPWHAKATRIFMESEATASDWLAGKLREEVLEIVTEPKRRAGYGE